MTKKKKIKQWECAKKKITKQFKNAPNTKESLKAAMDQIVKAQAVLNKDVKPLNADQFKTLKIGALVGYKTSRGYIQAEVSHTEGSWVFVKTTIGGMECNYQAYASKGEIYNLGDIIALDLNDIKVL